MELIYIAGAFVLGAIFHKGASALWARIQDSSAAKSIESKL
jgi:hypothetical protein